MGAKKAYKAICKVAVATVGKTNIPQVPCKSYVPTPFVKQCRFFRCKSYVPTLFV